MAAENKKEIEELKNHILEAEKTLEAAKKALFDLTGEDLSKYESAKPQRYTHRQNEAPNGKVIEGVFNGENMVGPEGKIFPVPANYASKSKLVEGDRLKLTVAEDGAFIFKQIGPIDRKNLVGDLVFEDNAYHVLVGDKRYNLLYAAVTYHKAKPGDRVTIVVPAREESDWAALENIIHNFTAAQESSVSDILELDLPEDSKISSPSGPGPQSEPQENNNTATLTDVTPNLESPPPPVPETEPMVADTVPVASPIQSDITENLETTGTPDQVAATGGWPAGPSLSDATYDDSHESTNSLGETIPGAAEESTVADLDI